VSITYAQWRKFLIYALALLLTAGAIILGISHQVLSKLTFAGDRVVYGKSLSELTRHISTELLKRPDLTPVSFQTEDGFTLSGYFIERKHAKFNAIICHGYRSAKELMYGYLDLFPDWNILLFDFRAHGGSDGAITSLGYHEYKDVLAASHYMRLVARRKNTQQLPLIVLGFSMGGAATLKAAENDPNLCDALIIDSTYARLSSTMLKAFSSKSYLPLYPFFPVIRWLFHYYAACNIHAMNPEKSVLRIKMPILFIHAARDSYLSSKNVLRLYANAQHEQSRLWIGPICRHGSLHAYFGNRYRHKVNKFLAKALPASHEKSTP